MTQTTSTETRGLSVAKGLQLRAFRGKVYTALTKDHLCEHSSNGLIVSGADSVVVAGAVRNAYSASSMADVLTGPVVLTAGGPITAGQRIKSGTAGVAFPIINSGNANATLDTSSAGLAFTNQPANDAVTFVSSSASDTQDVTIIGTTNGADTVVVETNAATGTTPVTTTKTDWGVILAVYTSSAAVGTITFKEDSGSATITTITAGNSTKGMDAVTGTTVYTLNNIPYVVCSGTSTKQIGFIGTDSTGAAVYDSQALSNTTAIAMNSAFYSVTYFMTGDLEATRTVSLKLGVAEAQDRIVGYAQEAAVAAGDTFLAYLY